MKIGKILKEAVGSYSPNSYPAKSMAPRKDFVPFSKKDGYNFPYQSNNDSVLPSSPVPPSPSSLPWELGHIIDDLSDAYIFLETASKKISNCQKNNPSLNKHQKSELFKFYKALKKTTQIVKKIGMRVEDVASLSSQPSPDLLVPTERKTIKRN